MEERLRDIELSQVAILAAVENLAATMEDRIQDTDDWRAKVDGILRGDGNGQKGHNVRLDRLEGAYKRLARVGWLLVTGVLALALRALWGLSD